MFFLCLSVNDARSPNVERGSRSSNWTRHDHASLTESVTLRQGFKSHGWLSVEHGKENLILSYCCNICAVVIQHHASLMKALLRHWARTAARLLAPFWSFALTKNKCQWFWALFYSRVKTVQMQVSQPDTQTDAVFLILFVTARCGVWISYRQFSDLLELDLAVLMLVHCQWKKWWCCNIKRVSNILADDSTTTMTVSNLI